MDTRIAVIDTHKCKPKKCNQECKRCCPVNKNGKECVVVDIESMASIAESLCIGCNLCVKACPFDAIKIIKIPSSINNISITHQWKENSFRLHRLPEPKLGHILGIVGQNGSGKSTAMQILSYKLKPNFGNYENPPVETDIQLSKRFRGTFLQNYFLKKGKVSFKVQQIKALLKMKELVNLTVGEIIGKFEQNDLFVDMLDLKKLWDRKVDVLSGGELQRLFCLVVALKRADVYIFDEPSNYLDIRQRFNMANLIKSVSDDQKYVMVVEHDLSILDYIADVVCITYGTPGAYGVSTRQYTIGNGINMFLDGFVRDENLRIRTTSFNFKNLKKEMQEFEDELRMVQEKMPAKGVDKYANGCVWLEYPSMTKTYDGFKLEVVGSKLILNAGITVILGENGTGKSLFVKMLAGLVEPDIIDEDALKLNISYKPQHTEEMFGENWMGLTVSHMLHKQIGSKMLDPQFKTDVLNILGINEMLDYGVATLSGGEQQKLAICLTLGKNADLYLIDEPSSFLDSESRLQASKAIKNFVNHNQKCALVVEHDILMGIYLAHSIFGRVIVFEGVPGVRTMTSSVLPLKEGMNLFLKGVGITFRQDVHSGRPRINKLDSANDREQKKSGEYFEIDDLA